MEKGIDETWLQNGFKVDQDIIYCRYAEILLTYAEAKIELNEIDNSVLDALNEVRARAYGVDKSDKASYPAFTSNDQSTLRHQLRVERRMEMAKEHMRYTDIIRWKLAEKVMNRKTYGILYPASLCIERVTSQEIGFGLSHRKWTRMVVQISPNWKKRVNVRHLLYVVGTIANICGLSLLRNFRSTRT